MPGTTESGRECEDESEKDIVDHLSEATGYFHDSEAAKLRDIADASGQKPVGLVKAAVEKEIERREWKCVYFRSEDEEREYPAWFAFEYYRIHKKKQQEYEAAMEELPTEKGPRLNEVQVHEQAYETLQDKAREHQAKAEQAERQLEEIGEDPAEVLEG